MSVVSTPKASSKDAIRQPKSRAPQKQPRLTVHPGPATKNNDSNIINSVLDRANAPGQNGLDEEVSPSYLSIPMKSLDGNISTPPCSTVKSSPGVHPTTGPGLVMDKGADVVPDVDVATPLCLPPCEGVPHVVDVDVLGDVGVGHHTPTVDMCMLMSSFIGEPDGVADVPNGVVNPSGDVAMSRSLVKL